MQAAGVSLKRVAFPVVATGAILSGACFLIQDQIQPWAVSKAFDLLYRELPSRVTVDRLQPGVMHEYEGWRVYYAARDDANEALLDLDLVTPSTSGAPPVYFHADRAYLKRTGDGFELSMSNGHVITEDHVRIQFAEQRLSLPAPSTLRPRSPRKMLPLRELFAEEQRLTAIYRADSNPSSGSSVQKERREIAERLSLPFAAFACAMAGAPLGVRAERRGRSSMFAAAVALALAYAIMYVAVEPMGLRPLAEYVVRAWIPNLLLIGAGVVLFIYADRVGS
jgi:lipopolysaccharide export LptBFGC system permease protein LptF